MSWVKAVYQPSAARAVWARVSALSPTLLMKMSAILVPSAILKLMAIAHGIIRGTGNADEHPPHSRSFT